MIRFNLEEFHARESSDAISGCLSLTTLSHPHLTYHIHNRINNHIPCNMINTQYNDTITMIHIHLCTWLFLVMISLHLYPYCGCHDSLIKEVYTHCVLYQVHYHRTGPGPPGRTRETLLTPGSHWPGGGGQLGR